MSDGPSYFVLDEIEWPDERARRPRRRELVEEAERARRAAASSSRAARAASTRSTPSSRPATRCRCTATTTTR